MFFYFMANLFISSFFVFGGEKYPDYRNIFYFDEIIGTVNRPKSVGYMKVGEGRVEYKINTEGFRDQELPSKKEKFKVLFVGSSWSFGWGLPEEKRWSNLIDRKLCNLSSYNASFPGALYDQVLLNLERVLSSKKAFDYIVIQIPPFDDNRLHTSAFSWHPETRKAYFKLEKGEFLLVPAKKKLPFIFKDIRGEGLWSYLKKGINKVMRDHFLFRSSQYLSDKTMEYLIKRTLKLLERKNLKALFLFNDPRFYKIISNTNIKIETLDLRKVIPPFHAINEEIGHVNFEGQQLIAKEIIPFIEKNIKGVELCEK